MPNPPLLLVDNVFDAIALYPGAVIDASSEAEGHEAFRVADYRRDRTWWQPATAGDRAHLDFSDNTPGGTDQRILTMITAGGFNQSTTSHTWEFLIRSAAAATVTQRLVNISGPVAFSIFRAAGTGFLGFGSSSTVLFTPNTAPPTDDAWHTIAMRFNDSDNTATLFVDGVSIATASYAPQAIGGASSAFTMMGTVGTFANATAGRIARVAYYAGARGNVGIADDHAAMMAGTALPASPVHEWNAQLDQGAQQLTDRGSSPTAHLRLGRTASVEVYDPLWAGGAWVGVDLGAGATRSPDFVYLDRGHNLWGAILVLEGADDGDFGTDTTRTLVRTIPALDANGEFVVGGDPSTGVCVTDEGACYALFSALTASQAWRARFVFADPTVVAMVPGILLGARTQLLNFGKTFDEDAGGRTQPTAQSTAGYRANDPTYSWRTVTLDLDLIGAPEYDSTMRTLRATLFETNQPWVCAMDSGTHPERAWMYTYDGTAWGMPKQRVYRAGRIVGREHMPRLR